LFSKTDLSAKSLLSSCISTQIVLEAGDFYILPSNATWYYLLAHYHIVKLNFQKYIVQYPFAIKLNGLLRQAVLSALNPNGVLVGAGSVFSEFPRGLFKFNPNGIDRTARFRWKPVPGIFHYRTRQGTGAWPVKPCSAKGPPMEPLAPGGALACAQGGLNRLALANMGRREA